uniref:E3 ubiquitin-protein ligase TRIM11-like n=1 Tax=Euleptes europaea TaxID=460621 RepID=UPI00253FBE7E|nr:E3 ubiquitin-protein ligase TRIM11-like [Euleptes europaea]
MAAGGPLKELCEEASCSVCLDFFRDPVTIAECGHNFCRACLARSWGASRAEASCCPQCGGRAQEGSLRPNQQLANLVGIIQKLGPQEGKGAEAKGGEGKGAVCERHQEPLRFFCREDVALLCVACRRSEEHQDHQVIPLEEPAGEKKGKIKPTWFFCCWHQAVVAARKERVCLKHQELLNLFCKDDEALICAVCDQSQEHNDHKIIPVEEASQEYKDQFCNCMDILREEKEKILAYKACIVKESQDLMKQTKGERQEKVTKFRQLHKFLDKQEKLVLAQMEELEKEVARNRDQHLAKLSEELSSLDSLIRKMEEKCQQPASELLQDVRSTLQRYEDKEAFEDPVAFPLALKWRVWDVNPLLEGIKEQFKDTLDSGLHVQKANVTLDPDTAHPLLVLSEDRKSVRWGEEAQALPDNPERFEKRYIVLGREGFTAGRHFWEVLVGSEEEWFVGVARKSVRRKGRIIFSPEGGIWAVGKWGGCYRAAIKGINPLLSLTGEPKRIRVCLNYAGGRVAFFDADRGSLLFEFSGASFHGETLLPFFYVWGKGHLRLSS